MATKALHLRGRRRPPYPMTMADCEVLRCDGEAGSLVQFDGGSRHAFVFPSVRQKPPRGPRIRGPRARRLPCSDRTPSMRFNRDGSSP